MHRYVPLGIFSSLKARLDRLVGRGVVDDRLLIELQEALISADVGVTVADSILQEIRDRARRERIEGPQQVRMAVQETVARRLAGEEAELNHGEHPPDVYLFLGANGSGKTTTIAKLAHRLLSQSKSVLLAAADTFRAAAIEQLEAWARRVGAETVKGRPGADPSAVVFDAISAAKARGTDYVLADTAGRQHTRENLMQELQKVTRVAEKALGRPPDEILLVLDGHTGQNAIRQAEEFAKAVPITGAVVTKLDGTAKGGAIIGIREQLGIPVKLVGIGEKPGDLIPFRSADFAAELLQ